MLMIFFCYTVDISLRVIPNRHLKSFENKKKLEYEKKIVKSNFNYTDDILMSIHLCSRRK